MDMIKKDNVKTKFSFKKVEVVFELLRKAFAKILNYTSRPGSILRNTKMQNRLIVSFIGLSFIPIVVSGVFSIKSSSESIKEKISTYSLQLVKQVNKNMDQSLSKIKSYTDDIIIMPEVNKSLPGYKDAQDTDKASIRNTFLAAVSRKFTNVKYVDDALIVFGDDKNSDSIHLKLYAKWKKEDIVNIININNQKDNTQNFTLTLSNISGIDENCIVIGRKISSGMSSEVLGHFLIALNQNYFKSIYEDIDIGKGAEIFLLDSNGTVISSKSKNIIIGKPFQEGKLIEQINKENKFIANTFSLKIGEEKQLIAYTKVQSTNWYIVSTIPYSYLNSETTQFTLKIAGLSVIILILIVIITFIISESISRPLKKLVQLMKESANGNLTIESSDNSRDEIGEVVRNYYAMVASIRNIVFNIHKAAEDVIDSSVHILMHSQEWVSSSKQINSAVEEMAVGASEQAFEANKGKGRMYELANNLNMIVDKSETVRNITENTKELSENTLVVINDLSKKTKETEDMTNSIISEIIKLNQNMGNITNIVKVISSISDQTNLLSLNASIEAARAGKAGRGFGVVAEEVKKLADQSKKSSQDIGIIINGIVSRTKEIVIKAEETTLALEMQKKAVNQADKAFNSIINENREIVLQLRNMHELIKLMDELKENTVASMEKVSLISESAASVSEEITATTEQQISSAYKLSELAESLDKMADELKENLEEFKV